ncbi:hypothetical protein ACJIZ3_014929 [Penstemon smallii]|uniref:ACB domain-containing protein n=1 Tax=Penstemon smallii TaxID=265156 RepID=A0ABD3RPF5_9LAMI
MDAVEILLLCVVGFSVLVFLFLDSPESKRIRHESEKSCVFYDSEGKTENGSLLAESVNESSEKVEIFKVNLQEIEEKEEAEENTIYASSEKSGSCRDDSWKNMGIIEDDNNDFFDDWEGIERTELDKIFGQAVVYVNNSDMNADKIDGDLKLQLYGLEKVALEGQCYESQPIALKVSARSKWNAWQKLGNMSQEIAMEKYVSILTKAIPQWKGENAVGIHDAITSEDQNSTSHN